MTVTPQKKAQMLAVVNALHAAVRAGRMGPWLLLKVRRLKWQVMRLKVKP